MMTLLMLLLWPVLVAIVSIVVANGGDGGGVGMIMRGMVVSPHMFIASLCGYLVALIRVVIYGQMLSS